MRIVVTPAQVVKWFDAQPNGQPDPRGPCQYRNGWYNYETQRWEKLNHF